LARVEVLRLVPEAEGAAVEGTARAGHQGGVAGGLGAVVDAEEPEPVPDQEAAEAGAAVLVAQAGEGAADDAGLGGGLEAPVLEVAEGLAVEGVAARGGDGVDDPSQGAPVLGRVVGGLDLDLLQELLRD